MPTLEQVTGVTGTLPQVAMLTMYTGFVLFALYVAAWALGRVSRRRRAERLAELDLAVKLALVLEKHDDETASRTDASSTPSEHEGGSQCPRQTSSSEQQA